jgi:hypothetical protein
MGSNLNLEVISFSETSVTPVRPQNGYKPDGHLHIPDISYNGEGDDGRAYLTGGKKKNLHVAEILHTQKR